MRLTSAALPQDRVARIFSINPAIGPHEGGSCRISILKAHLSLPKPLTKLTEKGFWRASNQPLWLASKASGTGTVWSILCTLDMRSEGLSDSQVKACPHHFIDRINVSGKYKDGKWRFLDLYLKARHVEAIAETAGDWIYERFMPGRTAVVLKALRHQEPGSLPEEVLQCWVRL
jgi:hypothetical protein